MGIERNKSIPRSYSCFGREAVTLLGQLIRIHRIERKIGIEELASRVGVSRDMMRRIEQGDPRCGIGLVFEAATIVGVPLFEGDRSRVTTLLNEQKDKLRLLPKAVHKSRAEVKDDF